MVGRALALAAGAPGAELIGDRHRPLVERAGEQVVRIDAQLVRLVDGERRCIVEADVGAVGDDDLPPAEPVARVVVAEGELVRVALRPEADRRRRWPRCGSYRARPDRERAPAIARSVAGRARSSRRRGGARARSRHSLASRYDSRSASGDRAVPIADRAAVGRRRSAARPDRARRPDAPRPCRSRSGCTG